MNISERIRKIADCIPKGKYFCDVGTDHGYLPYLLFKQNKIEQAQLIEINEKPLNYAKHTFVNTEFLNRVSFDISDGLDQMNSEVDLVAICGMGGENILSILEKNKDKVLNENRIFVISANKKMELVRKFCNENSMQILQEFMIYDYKYYPVALIQYSLNSTKYSEEDVLFGKYPLEDQASQGFYKEIQSKYKKIYRESSNLEIQRKLSILETKIK